MTRGASPDLLAARHQAEQVKDLVGRLGGDRFSAFAMSPTAKSILERWNTGEVAGLKIDPAAPAFTLKPVKVDDLDEYDRLVLDGVQRAAVLLCAKATEGAKLGGDPAKHNSVAMTRIQNEIRAVVDFAAGCLNLSYQREVGESQILRIG